MYSDIFDATSALSRALDDLSFSVPFVYNPLDYAKAPHWDYLTKYGSSRKRIIFLGMNPGPWGMGQIGVPFGEVNLVKDWVGIEGAVGKPTDECPAKPVTGFGCKRSEVSGKRLWGMVKERFGKPEDFFNEHFVINYCPLLFLDEGGRNITPDKLKKAERLAMSEICDPFLKFAFEYYQPEWLIGVGNYALECIERINTNSGIKMGKILHPSPANPHAAKDWDKKVVKSLQEQGVWS